MDGITLGPQDVDLSDISGTALRLDSVNNSVIAGLDLSWTGEGKSGTGIDMLSSSGNTIEYVTATDRQTGLRIGRYRYETYLDDSSGNTIQSNDFSGASYCGIDAWYGGGLGNRYQNNDLSNADDWAMAIGRDTEFEVSGNNFDGSKNGLRLYHMDSITFGAHDVDLHEVSGTALHFNSVNNSVISGLDVSWNGQTPSGIGIELISSSNNTVENVTATNRDWGGIKLGGYRTGDTSSGNAIQNSNVSGAGHYAIDAWHCGGTGNKYLNNNLSHAGSWALRIGHDTDFQIAGNDFTDGVNGLLLGNFANVSLTPAIVDVDLSSVQGTALQLATISNSQISGLDVSGIADTAVSLTGVNDCKISGLNVSWTGSGKSGTGLKVLSSSDNTIEFITAANRGTAIQIGFYHYEINSRNTFRHNSLTGAGGWAINAFLNRGLDNEFLDNDLSDSANGALFSTITGLDLSAESFDFSGIPGTSLRLEHVDDSYISGLDLSWTGAGKSGTGFEVMSSSNNTIEYVTAANRDTAIRIGFYHYHVSSGNTFRHNTLTGAGSWAINAWHNRGLNNEFVANNLSGSANGAVFGGIQGLNISPASFDFSGIAGTALRLDEVSDSTISGLDLSWTGTGKSGTGMMLLSSSNNVVEYITATNRNRAIQIDDNYNRDSSDNIFRDNDFSAAGDWPIHASYSRGTGNEFLDNDVSNSANGITFGAMGGLSLSGGDFTGIPGTAVLMTGVYDSQISGLDVSWTGTGTSGVGVQLRSSSNNTIEDITATNRNRAIEIDEYYHRYSTDNIFRHNALSRAADWSIYAAYSWGTGNEYLDNDLSSSANGVYFGAITGLNLSSESFDFSEIPGTALSLVGVSNSTISGLDVSWNGSGQSGIGIDVRSSSGNTIQGVTTRNRSTGVQFRDSTNTTISCSSILDNAYGIGVSGSSAGIAVNYSHIAVNSVAGVSNGAAATVDAENNYWGSVDGANPPGSGDVILGNVGADPFLISMPGCLSGNVPPFARVAGPYAIDEGGSVALDASASFDLDGSLVAFTWDLDGDGDYSDATGATPTLTWQQLYDAGINDDGIHTVAVQVEDDGGAIDRAATTITVSNVAPVIDAGLDIVLNDTGVLSATGSIDDLGADVWTGTVDYGDGTGEQPLAGNPERTFDLSHVYSMDGTYLVSVTLQDDEGGQGSDTLLVTVGHAVPTYIVTNTNDVGLGSLRHAIDWANADPDTDTIQFHIYDGGPQTIAIASALPTITQPAVVDGMSQPGYVDTPIVEVDGVGTASTVLTVATWGSTVQGLAIRTEGTAISYNGGGGHVLSNLDVSWTGSGKSGTGISLSNSSDNIIEYVSATNRDVGIATYRSSGNLIQHNDFSGAGSWGMQTDAIYTTGGNQYLFNNVSDGANGISLTWEHDATVSAGASDMKGISGTALYFDHVSNSHVSGADVSWTGTGKSGTGISLRYSSDNIIEYVSATNRDIGIATVHSDGNLIQHNDFSGAGSWGMKTHATGGNRYLFNNVSDSANGISISSENGTTVSAGASDMRNIPGTAVYLYSVSNTHVSEMDVSWTGDGKSGTGISLSHSSDNIIEYVSATNRDIGIATLRSGGNLIQHNDLSGAGSWGMQTDANYTTGGNQYLFNNVSDSANGISLTCEYGDGATVSAGASDMRNIPGTAIYLDVVSNSYVSGVDVSWTGDGKSGTGIRLRYASDNIIEYVSATNRDIGIATVHWVKSP